MSFYFQSIGKKSAVAAAASDKKDLPDHVKKLIAAVLNNPTNDVIDSAMVELSGHGGNLKLEIREFVPALGVPFRTTVGYGDDGKPTPAQCEAMEWAAGRSLASDGKPLPDEASASAKLGYASWKPPGSC